MWDFGISGSVGSYLQPEAAPTLPSGHSIGDYHQILIGHDVAFAWHHFQLWAEVFGTRFQVPNVGNADILSYYLEAKYKITPQLFVAARWNQQLYGNVPSTERAPGGEMTPGESTRASNIVFDLSATKSTGSFLITITIFNKRRLLAAQLTFRF
jgi:hypothetical protein